MVRAHSPPASGGREFTTAAAMGHNEGLDKVPPGVDRRGGDTFVYIDRGKNRDTDERTMKQHQR
ncbi:hypothetical protein DLJ54_05275 [Corynebacterium heidelbergense]|uniref:Uncharacterized protein n=1 Tax=Corynebacterium heidelbergense TaxID=2055947 RepID=A0A364V5S9_9CORY|nr:hypothetical protein DLJ54_05275 [Corynebacterium heidelbergense]